MCDGGVLLSEDCVANPQHCGGLGGCDGANSELAFEQRRMNSVVVMIVRAQHVHYVC